ncbi:hypothetical protein L0337_11535 [candidate division KSB1 bacterium]|nr:hypothetical protein [candidate division KSB1 bacterium]
MKRLFILLVTIVVGMTLPAFVEAQVSAAFDTARMQRDLDIMNAILDRLVFNTPSHFIRLGGDATKSIYLPDYGVIFLMPMHSHGPRVYSFSRDAERQYRQAVETYSRTTPRAKARSGSGSTAPKRDDLQKIKEPLVEFFAKYADAIGQLDDAEKIAIYATGGNDWFFSAGEGWAISSGSGRETGGKDMLAVARKADIVALRSGRLKSEDFSSRVAFQNVEPEVASSEVDIMARIIDTALQGRARQSMFHSSNSRGIYLEDYGVIFFTNVAIGHEFSMQIWEDLGKRAAPESIERRLLELQEASQQRRENWSVGFKKFKQQLGEVIADYGHTLRQLRPQDSIVITADLESAPEDAPQFLVCRVKKQQVDAFNARRISREQLLRQIAFMEY